MEEPKLVLIGIAVLLEAPQDEKAMLNRMSMVGDLIENAVRQVTASQPDCKPMNVISYHYLGEDWENAKRCSDCGIWASDYTKPNQIDGIALGCLIKGRFFCTQCRSKHTNLRINEI
jgi:hypothetical protein